MILRWQKSQRLADPLAGDVQAKLSRQFAWDRWDGNPAVTPQWLAAHSRWYSHRRYLIDGEYILAVLERKAPGLYGPIGRHHGGFEPLPGALEENVAVELGRCMSQCFLILPLASLSLSEVLKRQEALRVHRRSDEAVLRVEAMSVEDYVATRSRNLRKTLRKAERTIANNHWTIRLVERGSLHAVAPELLAVEQAGYRTVGRPLSERRSPVIRALLALDDVGRCRVWVVDGNDGIRGYLIAGHGLEQDYLYTTAIRESDASLSIGTLLYSTAITQILGEGRGVSLGPGDSPHKRRFATASKPRVDVVAVPARLAAPLRPLMRLALRWRTGTDWS